MNVWIDQNACTGDGLCEQMAPDVFVLLEDGLAYVQDSGGVFARSHGREENKDGTAIVPGRLEDLVVEASEECPGECIYIADP